ncbi:Nif11-like leader peptide family natural product precursor [Synechococcus sp. UW179A]|uniref:Nif11-like leader peptide family natural product precursor n=1 Tax=Synechococcus sp. UW179A TaxID=2575510 RepID=UPI000E0F28A6|nr:Nif11-like leader peptide family natural product precursor [Synechococcus sp. UW179A]
MSEEQLKAFLEKVKADSSLQEKLKTAADANAVVSIAKETGFSILAGEFQSLVDDAELESAAGGCQVNSAKLSFPPYCDFPPKNQIG